MFLLWETYSFRKKLLASTCCRLMLKDVRHVSDVRLNLISAGRLDDEGHIGSFYNGAWKVQ